MKDWLATIAAVAALLVGFFVIGELMSADCKAAGGLKLRQYYGAWNCYDKASLKVIKP